MQASQRSLDTVAALATPSGESAIAVVRATGPACPELVREIFGSRRPPLPRQAIHAGYRSRDGEIIDDVVYLFYEGPRSYTGEHVLEISCHGNPLIAARLLEDLKRRGCRNAEPGEFTRRAFLNGRLDLTQAEAVMELIQARSDRALRVANNQLRGQFGKQMMQLRSRLLETVATVEAYIDFPEEDLPPERREAEIESIQNVLTFCRRLIDSGKSSAFLRDGVKTLILGEPNAGKSSLLNALLGFDRAIVSEEAGTTRDFLRERVLLGGYSLQMMDTAGLREAETAIEREGVRRSLELAEETDLFLLVTDASRPSPALPPAVADRLSHSNCLLVQNKIDLGAAQEPSADLADFQRVAVSALSGEGLDELKGAIVAKIEAHFARDQDDLILVNARHSASLEDMKMGLEAALEAFGRADPPELVASELRGAIDAIGRVLGRVDTEDMLDVLFSSFCIGK